MINVNSPTPVRRRLVFRACVLVAILSAVSCSGERNVDNSNALFASVETIESPGQPGSGEPNLFVARSGRVYLTWIDETDDGHALRVATTDDAEWSNPVNVAAGDDWFVNWADFPSLVAHPSGLLATHWLQKSGPDTYAYDVMVTMSADGGTTWSPGKRPHTDAVQAEHGFVSILPWSDDRFFFVWLDGREVKGGHDGGHGAEGGAMTLRCALMDQDGVVHDERLLDDRVCDCCQTAAVLTSAGALVAYRDRSEGEIRDIARVRFDGDSWSEPAPLALDGWEIAGCPVNGPSLAVDGGTIAAVWFTGAHNTPRVQFALSDDDGRTFSPPQRMDDGDPIGRVDVVFVGGGVLVSWIEAVGESGEVRVRYIDSDGTPSESVTVTPMSRERASGFPRMAVRGDDVYFAWTDAGAESIVRTAVAHFK